MFNIWDVYGYRQIADLEVKQHYQSLNSKRNNDGAHNKDKSHRVKAR